MKLAILGSEGSGKTSYVNAITKHLDFSLLGEGAKDEITFRFSSYKDMLQMFLADPTLHLSFESYVIDFMHKNYLLWKENPPHEHIVCDRCPVDALAYYARYSVLTGQLSHTMDVLTYLQQGPTNHADDPFIFTAHQFAIEIVQDMDVLLVFGRPFLDLDLDSALEDGSRTLDRTERMDVYRFICAWIEQMKPQVQVEYFDKPDDMDIQTYIIERFTRINHILARFTGNKLPGTHALIE